MAIIWDEILDQMYLSVFHSVSNRAHGKRSVSPSRLGMLSTLFFLVRARDCTTFTLHDLADC